MKDLVKIGAFEEPNQNGINFRIWGPSVEVVSLLWWAKGVDRSPENIKMKKDAKGYHFVHLDKAQAGQHYQFKGPDGKALPDPASRYQPEGPHGPSEIISASYPWKDQNWRGLALNELVIYELHVGCFTEKGDFKGVAEKLFELKQLGINAIELMPVAQFSGHHNWGYDGVGLFAPHNTYGRPEDLKFLVDECHRHEMAVILDVVYNHLGPEGNYLPLWAPYFQDKYKTPWGEALNYDEAHSDEVRNYFLQNARQWFEEYHFDGLRLDAVHAIFDTSATPFLEELSRLKQELQHKLSKPLYLIAESDASDSRILESVENSGLGMDSHWADDLHHVIHTLLTKESDGYYQGYGEFKQLAKIYESGVLYQGEYSPSRGRRHGRSYAHIDRYRLLVCSQNHDQIGNRKEGERLISLVGAEKQKLAAASVLLSPMLPLLFMGEERGSTSPFLYFVDHQDKQLMEAVRKGRKEEFAAFGWSGDVPDPGAKSTFLKSKINWNEKNEDLLKCYEALIGLSKKIRREGLFERGKVKIHFEEERKYLRLQSLVRPFEVHLNYADQELSVEAIGQLIFATAKKTELKDEKLNIAGFSAAVIEGEGQQ